MAVKKTKYPKAPKKSASVTTWEKYRDRIKEVDRKNSQIDSDKKKKASLISSVVKMRKTRK